MTSQLASRVLIPHLTVRSGKGTAEIYKAFGAEEHQPDDGVRFLHCHRSIRSRAFTVNPKISI